MDIIIIEDAPKVRETIIAMIDDNYNDIRVLAECSSIQDAEILIKKIKPQLLFLDIDLLDGDGFSLLKKFTTKAFKTIFITGSPHRALEAMKQDAVDYIVKPINPDELYKAIDKAKQLIDKEQEYNLFQFLSTNLIASKPNKRITLKTLTTVHSLVISDIIRCESEGKYTTFFLINAKPIVVSIPIKEYEEQLTQFGFYRIHQSHLINMLYFVSVAKDIDTTILLSNGDKIPLSSRKKADFLEFIETKM